MTNDAQAYLIGAILPRLAANSWDLTRLSSLMIESAPVPSLLWCGCAAALVGSFCKFQAGRNNN